MKLFTNKFALVVLILLWACIVAVSPVVLLLIDVVRGNIFSKQKMKFLWLQNWRDLQLGSSNVKKDWNKATWF